LTPGKSQVQQAHALCSCHNMTLHVVIHFQTHAIAPAEAGSCPCCGGGGGASNLVLSAIILCIPIPTPSMTANSTAHPIAEFLAALNPPRTASDPPVKKPAMIALYLFGVVNGTVAQLVKNLQEISRLDVRVFLLPESFDSTIVCREHATPDSEVSAQYWCSCLYRCECANASFAVW